MLRALKSLVPERHPARLFWHRLKAFAAALLFGFPARRLTVIGITGTDGKTTTVAMVAHILHSSGVRTGALTTAFFRDGEKIEWNSTQKTSPSPFLVQRFFRRLVRHGCTHAVLEYSSHGLVQHRMDFTWPVVAAITNTSPEHLDYHGSLEQYRKDKGLLLRMLRGRGTKVLNTDDETYDMYRAIVSERTVDYSPQHHPYHSLTLPIPGRFNVSNALCAIACAEAVGIPAHRSVEALASFPGVPGRMERIDGGQPFGVYVDFTVTPAAYEATLRTMRELLTPGRRLLVLTGSCGDRMKEKRPIIGRLCAEFADVVVVTNEDPYTEDPEKIIDEIWAGIVKTSQRDISTYRISHRREAMVFILQQARPGDVVLLCGKGSDTTMWTKEGQVPWNEREIVRGLLRKSFS